MILRLLSIISIILFFLLCNTKRCTAEGTCKTARAEFFISDDQFVPERQFIVRCRITLPSEEYIELDKTTVKYYLRLNSTQRVLLLGTWTRYTGGLNPRGNWTDGDAEANELIKIQSGPDPKATNNFDALLTPRSHSAQGEYYCDYTQLYMSHAVGIQTESCVSNRWSSSHPVYEGSQLKQVMDGTFIKTKPFTIACAVETILGPRLESVYAYKIRYYVDTYMDEANIALGYWKVNVANNIKEFTPEEESANMTCAPGSESDLILSAKIMPKNFKAEGDYYCTLQVQLYENWSWLQEISSSRQAVVGETGYTARIANKEGEFVIGRSFPLECQVQGPDVGVLRYTIKYNFTESDEMNGTIGCCVGQYFITVNQNGLETNRTFFEGDCPYLKAEEEKINELNDDMNKTVRVMLTASSKKAEGLYQCTAVVEREGDLITRDDISPNKWLKAIIPPELHIPSLVNNEFFPGDTFTVQCQIDWTNLPHLDDVVYYNVFFYYEPKTLLERIVLAFWEKRQNEKNPNFTPIQGLSSAKIAEHPFDASNWMFGIIITPIKLKAAGDYYCAIEIMNYEAAFQGTPFSLLKFRAITSNKETIMGKTNVNVSLEAELPGHTFTINETFTLNCIPTGTFLENIFYYRTAFVFEPNNDTEIPLGSWDTYPTTQPYFNAIENIASYSDYFESIQSGKPNKILLLPITEKAEGNYWCRISAIEEIDSDAKRIKPADVIADSNRLALQSQSGFGAQLILSKRQFKVGLIFVANCTVGGDGLRPDDDFRVDFYFSSIKRDKTFIGSWNKTDWDLKDFPELSSIAPKNTPRFPIYKLGIRPKNADAEGHYSCELVMNEQTTAAKRHDYASKWIPIIGSSGNQGACFVYPNSFTPGRTTISLMNIVYGPKLKSSYSHTVSIHFKPMIKAKNAAEPAYGDRMLLAVWETFPSTEKAFFTQKSESSDFEIENHSDPVDMTDDEEISYELLIRPTNEKAQGLYECDIEIFNRNPETLSSDMHVKNVDTFNVSYAVTVDKTP